MTKGSLGWQPCLFVWRPKTPHRNPPCPPPRPPNTVQQQSGDRLMNEIQWALEEVKNRSNKKSRAVPPVRRRMGQPPKGVTHTMPSVPPRPHPTPLYSRKRKRSALFGLNNFLQGFSFMEGLHTECAEETNPIQHRPRTGACGDHVPRLATNPVAHAKPPRHGKPKSNNTNEWTCRTVSGGETPLDPR